jgi:hypothetical protein
MRPYATCVCGLKRCGHLSFLVYSLLVSYSPMRPYATSVCGLKLLVHAALRYLCLNRWCLFATCIWRYWATRRHALLRLSYGSTKARRDARQLAVYVEGERRQQLHPHLSSPILTYAHLHLHLRARYLHLLPPDIHPILTYPDVCSRMISLYLYYLIY